MSNLFADMAPRSADVALRGKRIVLRELTLGHLGALVARHEGLAAAMEGGDFYSLLLAEGPRSMCDVIAMSAGLRLADVESMRLRPAALSGAVLTILSISLPVAGGSEPAGKQEAGRTARKNAWAELAARLVQLGHPDPLRYSPRQALAWVAAGEVMRRHELRELLSMTLHAHSGDRAAVRKFMEN